MAPSAVAGSLALEPVDRPAAGGRPAVSSIFSAAAWRRAARGQPHRSRAGVVELEEAHALGGARRSSPSGDLAGHRVADAVAQVASAGRRRRPRPRPAPGAGAVGVSGRQAGCGVARPAAWQRGQDRSGPGVWASAATRSDQRKPRRSAAFGQTRAARSRDSFETRRADRAACALRRDARGDILSGQHLARRNPAARFITAYCRSCPSPMFQGVIPALVTPFRDGAVDEDAFVALVERQIAGGRPRPGAGRHHRRDRDPEPRRAPARGRAVRRDRRAAACR